MNSLNQENQVSQMIEKTLQVLCSLVIAAAPLCAVWMLHATPVIALV